MNFMIQHINITRGGHSKRATIAASHSKTEQRELLLLRKKLEVGKGQRKNMSYII
jgi:hypothetical protein